MTKLSFQKMVFGILPVALSLTFFFPPGAMASDASSSRELRVVALGTSFTAGKGVFQSDAFPAKLEGLLKSEGLNVRVANEGVNGNSTSDMMHRASDAAPKDTALVIYEYAWGNDRKKGIDPQGTIENSRKIIAGLVERQIQVLLILRAPNRMQLEKTLHLFGSTIAENGLSYVAIEQPPSARLPDGQFHPTVQAHAEIAAELLPHVKKMLERTRSGEAAKNP